MLLDERNKVHSVIEGAFDSSLLGHYDMKVETGGGGLCELGHVQEDKDEEGYWVCVRVFVPKHLVEEEG